MRVIAITGTARSPNAHEMPLPTLTEGTVRVRVQASSVNAFDGLVARAILDGRGEHRFPLVLGRDFAGVVDAIGPNVRGYAVGHEVFGVVDGGAFAEYVTVPAHIGLARRPRSLSADIAGTLGLAGSTARQTVDALALTAGRTVLVSGALGGVGSLVIQLATAQGARVIATAGSATEDAYARGLGAVATVSPHAIIDGLRAHILEGVHAVAHLAGNAQQLARLVLPGGRFASTSVGAEEILGLPLTVTRIFASPTIERLDWLARAAADGRLRVPVHRVYTLEQVPHALIDYARGGTLGKLAITVP